MTTIDIRAEQTKAGERGDAREAMNAAAKDVCNAAEELMDGSSRDEQELTNILRASLREWRKAKAAYQAIAI